MRPRPRPLRSALVAFVGVWLLAASTGPAAGSPPSAERRLPALTPVSPDALTRALEAGQLSPARYALERWASIVDPGSVRPRFGPIAPPDPRSGTSLARDLLLRLDQLGPRASARARRLLARPTDGPNDPDTPPGTDVGYSVDEEPPLCGVEVCVHYVATSGNRVPFVDAGGTIGIPDYVEGVADVLTDVWAFEIDDLGYRAPKSDATSPNDGGGAELDVYLTNLGDDGLYGYCTSDDPRLFGGYRFFDFSAYCVLDNDYVEFGYPDPTLPLQVTAAHEFFHAVQFAYDLYEDTWFMEATATWIEDELYDTIDDNRQYLPTSPLSNPTIPLDRSGGFRVYGDWIFFRFLSEYLGDIADDREVVRKIWVKADGSKVGPDQFSSQAIATVVDNETKGGSPWTFEKAFRDFGVWNVDPSTFYSEGTFYDGAPVGSSDTVNPASSPVRLTDRVDHLAHRLVRLVRGQAVGGGAELRVTIDGPAGATSPVAAVVSIATGGVVTTRPIPLNGKGNGSVKVGFGTGVKRVIVVLGNASVRYTNCYDFSGPYACNGGDPRDDDQPFKLTARLV